MANTISSLPVQGAPPGSKREWLHPPLHYGGKAERHWNAPFSNRSWHAATVELFASCVRLLPNGGCDGIAARLRYVGPAKPRGRLRRNVMHSPNLIAQRVLRLASQANTECSQSRHPGRKGTASRARILSGAWRPF